MQATPLQGLRRPSVYRHHGAVQRLICRASRQPFSRKIVASPQLDKGSQLAHVAKALEHVSLAVALVAHARTAVNGLQGASLQSPSQVQGPVVGVQPADHMAIRHPTPHPLAGLWLTLPVLLAFLFNKLHAALTGGRAASSRTAHVSEEAAARLLRLEALSTQQHQSLEALGKQVEKLRARVRIVGRDLTMPLKQAEQGMAQQAEVLVGVTQRLQQVEQGVRDTQDLVAGMQGVSAKQFELIRQVIQRQKEQEQQRLSASGVQAQQQAAVPKPSSSSSSSSSSREMDGVRKASRGRAASKPPSRPSERASRLGHAPAAAAPQPAPAAGTNGSGPELDEWGRQRVPMPSSVTTSSSEAPSVAPQPATPPTEAGEGLGAASAEGLAQGEAAPAPSPLSKGPLDAAPSSLDSAPPGLPTTRPGASVTSRLIHAAVTSSGGGAWGPSVSAGGAPWGPSGPSVGAAAQAQAPQQSGSSSSSAGGMEGSAGSTSAGGAAGEGQEEQQPLGLPRPSARPPSPGLPVASASSTSSTSGSGVSSNSNGGEAPGTAQAGGLSRAISDILNSDPFYLTEQQMYNMLTKRMRLSDLPPRQGGSDSQGGSEGGGEGGPQGPQGPGPRPGSPGGSGGEGVRTGSGGSSVETSQGSGNGGEAVDVVEKLLQQLRAGAFEGALGEETLKELGLGSGPGRGQALGEGEGEDEDGQQDVADSSRGSAGGAGVEGGEHLPAAAAAAAAAAAEADAASERATAADTVAGAAAAGAQAAHAGEREGEHPSSRRVLHHQADHVTIEERSDGTVLFAFSDDEEGEPSPGGKLGGEEGQEGEGRL